MKKKIINKIQSMSGEFSVYALFDDWISMYAIATAQAVDFNEEREKAYLQIASKHKDKMSDFIELNGLLIQAFEEKMEDVLGYIYMHLELGSSRTGQFFTPYHLCQLMAQMGATRKDFYEINEPSCGGGGNIIAFAEELERQGVDFRTKMRATCQDIDVRAVYMCYLQCSYYGIPAIVFQSDTLCDPLGQKSTTGRLFTPQLLINQMTMKGGQ